VAKALGGEGQSGDWTMAALRCSGEGGVFLNEIPAPGIISLQFRLAGERFFGTGFSKSGRQEFFYDRAGRRKFECEGFLQDGEGAGLFHFAAEPRYSQEMKSLGFERIDGDKQWAMAIHDVSLKFARDIKAENLQGLDTDKLIAFKIHGVTPEFIEGIRSAGVNVSDSDKLIAFRISWRVSGVHFRGFTRRG